LRRNTFRGGVRGTADPSTPLRYGRDDTSARNGQKNAFLPATTFHGSVVLPFVIPTDAEGSAV
jgi:hypothetical protein